MVLMLCVPYFMNNLNVLKPQDSFKLDFLKHMITLSCSFCDDIFNNMSHTSIKGHLISIFELLLIKNQIVNLTFGQIFFVITLNYQPQMENVKIFLMAYWAQLGPHLLFAFLPQKFTTF